MNSYSNLTEAIEAEVIAPLGNSAAEYDVKAIADKVIAFDLWNHDYYRQVTADDFWAIVEKHAL